MVDDLSSLPNDDVIGVVLGASGAGVVREDTNARANREIGQHPGASRPYLDDTMLLTGVLDDHIGERSAINVADKAVTLIDRVPLRAPVPGHCHPSAIGQYPSLFRSVTYNRGQHRDRNVVHVAHANTVHHQVEEGEHPCPHFGYAGQVVREMRGWG